MSSWCIFYLKNVSRTSFKCSYRIHAQNSGFGNRNSSYDQFKAFAEVIALLRFLDIMSL